MSAGIVSVRGNLTPLVWPAAIEARIAAAQALREEWDAARALRNSAARELGMEHEAVQRSAARIFLEAQGWRLRDSRAHPPTLFGHRLSKAGRGDAISAALIRHAHFALLGQDIVAVVTHLYNARDLEALPPDIAVDLLPVSWYNSKTIAACLRFDGTTNTTPRRASRRSPNNRNHPAGTAGKGLKMSHTHDRETPEAAHARLAAELENLSDLIASKYDRQGTGCCGSPPHPAMHRLADQLYDEASAEWGCCSEEYRKRVGAESAASAYAQIAEADATPDMTPEELEAQQEALARMCIAEDYPNGLPTNDLTGDTRGHGE